MLSAKVILSCVDDIEELSSKLRRHWSMKVHQDNYDYLIKHLKHIGGYALELAAEVRLQNVKKCK